MTHHDQMRLAVETRLSLRTVERWCRGDTVNDSTETALLRAMAQLGIRRDNEGHETEKAAP